MIRCPQCQAEVAEGKRFCPQCGTRMPESPAVPLETPPPASPAEAGRTILLPPEPDTAKTMLVPPEPAPGADAARTVLLPPDTSGSAAAPVSTEESLPASGSLPSSSGQPTILAGPPPEQGSPTIFTPPAPPSGGGFGLPASPPPAAPPSGGGFGLPASPPPAVPPSGGGFSVPASAAGVEPVPPQKKGRNIWMIVGIIVGVLVLGCVLVLGGLYFAGQRAVQSLGTAVSETAVSISEPAVSIEFPNILEQDTLDNEADSLFTAEKTDAADYRYENGAFVIEVAEPDYVAWQLIPGVRGDVSFEMDATISGPRSNAAALLFRYQDQDNFYLFSVNGNGQYSVEVYKDNSPTTLVDWTSSPAISAAGVTNRLKVEIVGDDLTFYCNGRKLTSLNDSTFGSGELGFATNTFSDGNGTVSFDNLLVRGK